MVRARRNSGHIIAGWRDRPSYHLPLFGFAILAKGWQSTLIAVAMTRKRNSAPDQSSDPIAAKVPTVRPKEQVVRQRSEQKRAIETRERIIEAAIDEFASRGFEGASARTIAEHAGVRHTMVTYHFNGKEGLWRAVMDRMSRTFTVSQFERLEGLRGVDEALQLRLLLEEFARYSAHNPNLHKLMTHAANRSSPDIEILVSEYVLEYFQMIANLIESAQKKGLFVQGDPNHLHYLFIGAVTRIFMQSPEVERVIQQSPFDPLFITKHVEACLGLFFVHAPVHR